MVRRKRYFHLQIVQAKVTILIQSQSTSNFDTKTRITLWSHLSSFFYVNKFFLHNLIMTSVADIFEDYVESKSLYYRKRNVKKYWLHSFFEKKRFTELAFRNWSEHARIAKHGRRISTYCVHSDLRIFTFRMRDNDTKIMI